jgi:hypothetical protein
MAFARLPGDDLLDGLCLRFLKDVFFFQQGINRRSQILLTQIFTSTDLL